MHIPPDLFLLALDLSSYTIKKASSLQSTVCGFHIFVLFYGNFTVDSVPGVQC